jgi:SAM-dependent methyltransferase
VRVTHNVHTNFDSMERVNLGCGPNAPAGWINVDGSWNAWLSNHESLRKVLTAIPVIRRTMPGPRWAARPLVHDLTNPLPFKTNSVSFIYGAHVLEHLYRVDGQKLLLECRRVLKPAGVIRLVVPDLNAFVNEYLGSKNGNPCRETISAAADRLNEKLAFRSPAPPAGNLFFRLYSLWKDFHHHKWMYDADSLIHHMKEAGFIGVEQRAFLDSDIPRIEEVEEPSRVLEGAGVCVEGKKAE